MSHCNDNIPPMPPCDMEKHIIIQILEPIGVEAFSTDPTRNEIRFEFRSELSIEAHTERLFDFWNQCNAIALINQRQHISDSEIPIEEWNNSTRMMVLIYFCKRIFNR